MQELIMCLALLTMLSVIYMVRDHHKTLQEMKKPKEKLPKQSEPVKKRKISERGESIRSHEASLGPLRRSMNLEVPHIEYISSENPTRSVNLGKTQREDPSERLRRSFLSSHLTTLKKRSSFFADSTSIAQKKQKFLDILAMQAPWSKNEPYSTLPPTMFSTGESNSKLSFGQDTNRQSSGIKTEKPLDSNAAFSKEQEQLDSLLPGLDKKNSLFGNNVDAFASPKINTNTEAAFSSNTNPEDKTNLNRNSLFGTENKNAVFGSSQTKTDMFSGFSNSNPIEKKESLSGKPLESSSLFVGSIKNSTETHGKNSLFTPTQTDAPATHDTKYVSEEQWKSFQSGNKQHQSLFTPKSEKLPSDKEFSSFNPQENQPNSTGNKPSSFLNSSDNKQTTLFSNSDTKTNSLFTNTGNMFGGVPNSSENKPGSLPGTAENKTTSFFGVPEKKEGSGGTENKTAGLFGATEIKQNNLFGATGNQPSGVSGTVQNKPGDLPSVAENKPGGLFGATENKTGSLFVATENKTGNQFGTTENKTGSLFGGTENKTGNQFGTTENKTGSLFGTTENKSGSLFGTTENKTGSMLDASGTQSNSLFNPSEKKPNISEHSQKEAASLNLSDSQRTILSNEKQSSTLFGASQNQVNFPVQKNDSGFGKSLFGQDPTQSSQSLFQPDKSNGLSGFPSSNTGNQGSLFGNANQPNQNFPSSSSLFGTNSQR